MAYNYSPKDLFASEDSDSDATVDLSTQRVSEPRQIADVDLITTAQNEKRQRLKHRISSSESDDDSAGPPCEPSSMLSSGHTSKEPVRLSSVAEVPSGENVAVSGADERVLNSQQPTNSNQMNERPLCRYGAKCYRRNPSHFAEFRHPGSVRVCSVLPTVISDTKPIQEEQMISSL